jgi:NADPH2 dehydrogenase
MDDGVQIDPQLPIRIPSGLAMLVPKTGACRCVEMKVTDAVHAKGSYIFLQLWALGRAARPDVLAKQDPPSPYVSASRITLTGIEDPPRALTEPEIEEYIAAYAKAASNAVHRAGFDGIEVHSANGYLLD